MNNSRRKFLRLAGFATLGLGVKPALDLVGHAVPDALATSEQPQYAPNPKALKAKQWGMVIDTKKLTTPEQFDKIINACHSIHNVPSIPETKTEIKWIWGEDFSGSFTDNEQPYLPEDVEHKKFLLLCNQCGDPACVRVCPTKATFKRESDGIVMMDMHRCIGCRFCMAACPYGARSFNFGDPRPYVEKPNPTFPTRMRGVVEKCTFCYERLDEGLLPACVEASEGAILFGDLDDPKSEVRQALRENFTIRRKPTLGTQPSIYYII